MYEPVDFAELEEVLREDLGNPEFKFGFGHLYDNLSKQYRAVPVRLLTFKNLMGCYFPRRLIVFDQQGRKHVFNNLSFTTAYALEQGDMYYYVGIENAADAVTEK
ncbi:hypothetical protein [Planctomicrobium sp. SH664]|uniref:hypothetical protein n=1 Tax=Planctomicrobium sp. SH664 TaxID=3448125 RepID=UPI003F5AE861